MKIRVYHPHETEFTLDTETLSNIVYYATGDRWEEMFEKEDSDSLEKIDHFFTLIKLIDEGYPFRIMPAITKLDMDWWIQYWINKGEFFFEEYRRTCKNRYLVYLEYTDEIQFLNQDAIDCYTEDLMKIDKKLKIYNSLYEED